MPDFIPGADLSRSFFDEAVQPLLNEVFPGLAYSAGLIGTGSEVLGMDTEMSRDHGWGPRVDLFLTKADLRQLGPVMDETLRRRLPHDHRGYPTSFTAPGSDGSRLLQGKSEGPVDHFIGIMSVPGFFLTYLGFDIAERLDPADWLTFPQQKLRTISQGPVFHDEAGLLQARRQFAYFPHDVWLYLLASGWARIGQEEHLMGRAGLVSDEVGSAIIGSRLVRDIMRLCFLMERTYIPYPKWFGTAFARLACSHDVLPALQQAATASGWQEREKHLVTAYERIASMHNALKLTDPIPVEAVNFFDRPFKVIAIRGFAEALRSQITDPEVKAIASDRLIGSIDQLSDSTDLVESTSRRLALRRLYVGHPEESPTKDLGRGGSQDPS